jgi:hypothetical protein
MAGPNYLSKLHLHLSDTKANNLGDGGQSSSVDATEYKLKTKNQAIVKRTTVVRKDNRLHNRDIANDVKAEHSLFAA